MQGGMYYTARMALFAFGLSAVIAGVHAAVTWSNDDGFRWAPMVGLPALGVVSGVVVGGAKGRLSGSSCGRGRSARQ